MKPQHILKYFFVIAVIIGCQKDSAEVDALASNSKIYLEKLYSKVNISSDIVYSTISNGGEKINLKMDVYQGEGATDENRVVVILAHGGTFISGSKLNPNMVKIATDLAKRGYVVASINYRLLSLSSATLTSLLSAAVSPDLSLIQAAITAVWDMRAAVRYFKKEAKTYKIDTNRIFVGGYSAGAIMAIHTAYLSDIDEYKSLASNDAANKSIEDMVKKNGGVEGTTDTTFDSSVKGVFSISGSIISLDVIDKNEPLIISYHAKDDQTVPFESGNSNFSFLNIKTYGSGSISKKANELSIPNFLLSEDKGGHDGFFKCDDCLEKMVKSLHGYL